MKSWNAHLTSWANMMHFAMAGNMILYPTGKQEALCHNMEYDIMPNGQTGSTLPWQGIYDAQWQTGSTLPWQGVYTCLMGK